MSIAVIAVTRGIVLRTIPMWEVKDVAVDQRAGRVFLIGNTAVTTLDGRTGAIVTTAALPGGFYIYKGFGLDETSGRLFVALEGFAPPHGTATSPPNLLAMIDTRTGSLVRTITQSGGVLAGKVVVDGPAKIVLSWSTNTDPTLATVLDSRTGAVLRQVRLPLPPGGFNGPTVVDPRTGDIFGYTGKGIRAIHPGRWTQSRAVTSIAFPFGEALAINARTHRIFGIEIDPPAGSYHSVLRAACTAIRCT